MSQLTFFQAIIIIIQLVISNFFNPWMILIFFLIFINLLVSKLSFSTITFHHPLTITNLINHLVCFQNYPYKFKFIFHNLISLILILNSFNFLLKKKIKLILQDLPFIDIILISQILGVLGMFQP